jgi:hypothetical protein
MLLLCNLSLCFAVRHSLTDIARQCIIQHAASWHAHASPAACTSDRGLLQQTHAKIKAPLGGAALGTRLQNLCPSAEVGLGWSAGMPQVGGGEAFAGSAANQVGLESIKLMATSVATSGPRITSSVRQSCAGLPASMHCSVELQDHL